MQKYNILLLNKSNLTPCTLCTQILHLLNSRMLPLFLIILAIVPTCHEKMQPFY